MACFSSQTTNEPTQRAVFISLPRIKPIDIEFKDIRFVVDDGQNGKKEILRGVSGQLLSGQLTAIMGPSGAGKTSLLNIFTGFVKEGVTGSVTAVGKDSFLKDTCYIMQDDQLSPHFTVQEVMEMAADCKLGTSLSPKCKSMIIEELLHTIGLLNARSTRCNHLSGGQRKRLSIALELVDNPPVMFLDEPTSGLDSVSTIQCVAMLRALAKGGRNIVCTIHQPAASVFEMFDHVIVLGSGKAVYQGATSNILNFLSYIGLECPKYHNVADFMMDVVCGELGDHNLALEKLSNKKQWRTEASMRGATELESFKPGESKAVVLVQRPSEFDRFWILLNRSFLQMYRDWTLTHMRLALHVLVGIIFGLYYEGVGWDGSKVVSNFGYFMCNIIYMAYTSMMPGVLRYPAELRILKKEQFNNWYQLKTYYIATILANIPVQMLFCAVFTSISYVMSRQLLDWERFMMFLVMCQLNSFMSESIGIFLGTVCKPVNGTFVGSVMIAIFLLFAGYVIFATHMPLYISWVRHLNYMRYVLEGLAISVYGYGRSKLACPEKENYCHLRIPAAALKEIGFEDGRFWIDVIAICFMIVITRLVAFITLKRKITSNT